MTRARIEIFPTRRRPGYAAVVWAGQSGAPRVYQVFFAAQRDDAEADARQYADALLSGGVEDLTGGRGRS